MWSQGSDMNKPLNCLEVVEMFSVSVVFVLSHLVLSVPDKKSFLEDIEVLLGSQD